MTPRAVLAVLALFVSQPLLNASLCEAGSDPNFFRMSEKWNERFQYLGERTVEIVPGQAPSKPALKKAGAAKYFPAKSEEPDPAVEYVPPPEMLDYRELKRAPSQNVALYENQVVTFSSARGVQRYLAVDPGIVELGVPEPGIFQIKGEGLGTTFVHVWDPEGRFTFRVQVTRAQRPLTQETRRYLQDIEEGEPFKLGYEQNRTAFYDGNGFETLGQTSLNYEQAFTMSGDTPYGRLDSIAVLRNLEGRGAAEYAEARVSLLDGQVGPFDNFDFHVGDNRIENGLMAIPTMRLRGVNLIFYDRENRTKNSFFYGRELPSIIGTISQASALKAVDSFIGGGVVERRLNEAAKWKLAYAQAYGQQRPDFLNRRAAEFIQTYQLNEVTQLEIDAAHDTEHGAYTSTLTRNMEGLRLKGQYRDISNEFLTIIGNPGQQGEQGFRMDGLWRPNEKIEASYLGDVFRDRLFPFPGEEDRYNVDHDANLFYYLTPKSHLRFEFRDFNETARISPLRDRVYGAGFTQGFTLWDRNMSFFTSIQDRNFESLNNPTLNYRNDRLMTGFQTPLWWGVAFSAQQEFNYLEETTSRVIVHPRAYTYTLNYSRSIGDTPFTTDLSLRYRDEEEAGSERSFLVGEDRLEATGRLAYRIDNIEFYLDGRLSSIEAEDLDREPTRFEAEISTGFRYVFDTGVRWQASGAFEGTVYNDLNNDGQRQAGEPGMPAMKVYASEEPAITDDKGYWKSGNVTGKRGIVRLADESIPPGFVPSTPTTQTLPVRNGGRQRVDFGLSARSAILGYVFQDLNGNGTFDPADESLGGARIVLDGKVSRYSDVRGSYRFVDSALGKHQIQLDFATLPEGYLPRSPISHSIELNEGVTYRVDFIVLAERTVSGRVFVDKNRSGMLEEGEPGVPDVRVTLGDLTAETDAEGYYLFNEIPAGTFTLAPDPASLRVYRSGFRQELTFSRKSAVYKIDIPVSEGE